MRRNRLSMGLAISLGTLALQLAGVPVQVIGVFQTESGYDTVLGSDAICWQTDDDTDAELLRSCPDGNSLQAGTPPEGDRGLLRTNTVYHYSADVSINLTSWGLTCSRNSTENASALVVSASVVACRVGVSAGLCSPFLVTDRDADTNRDTDRHLISTEEDQESSNTNTAVIQSDPVFHGLTYDSCLYQFQMDIPMMVNSTGEYIVIVALKMNAEGSSPKTEPTTQMTIDMANAVQPYSLISYQNEPQILSVTQGTRYGAYVAVGIAATILIFLLLQTILHRNHVSLKMGQAKFLMVFLLAGLSAVCCSILLEPRNDLYCQLGLPAVFVSLQLFYAITVGRVWRIHSVISPAVLQSMDWTHQDAFVQSFVFEALRKYTSCMLTWSNRNRPKRLHKTFTEKQLIMVVVLFTLPQVIVQALAMYYQPWQMAVEWNDDESIGRQRCALPEDLPYASSIFYYGVYMFIILLLILFAMARTARGLPTFFNETKVIFDSLTSSIFLALLGIGIVLGTSSPTTSPNVPYIVGIVLILTVTLKSSLRLLLPKLRLAWNQEVIIVSNLVTEHSKVVRDKRARQESRRLRRQGFSFNQSTTGSSIGGFESVSMSRSNVHISGLSLDGSHQSSNPLSRSWRSSNNHQMRKFQQDNLNTNTTMDSSAVSVDIEAPSLPTLPAATQATKGDNSQKEADSKDTPPVSKVEPSDEMKKDDAGSMQLKEAELPELEPYEAKLSVEFAPDFFKKSPEPPSAGESSELGEPPSARFGLKETQESLRKLYTIPSLRKLPTAPTTSKTQKPNNEEAILKALDLEVLLKKLKKKVLTGIEVTENDWKNVRNTSFEMETLLVEEDKGSNNEELLGGFGTDESTVDSLENENEDEYPDMLEEAKESSRIKRRNRRRSSRSGRKFLHKHPGGLLIDPAEALEILGEGPMRFSNPRRSVHTQVGSLSDDDQESFRLLRADWILEEDDIRGRKQRGLTGGLALGLASTTLGLANGTIGLANDGARQAIGLGKNTIGFANTGAQQAIGLGKNTIVLANTGAKQAFGLTKTGARQAFDLTKTAGKQAFGLTKTVAKPITGLASSVGKPIAHVLPTAVTDGVAKSGQAVASGLTTSITMSGQAVVKSGQAVASGLANGITMSSEAVAKSGQVVASGLTTGITKSGQAVASGVTSSMALSGQAVASSGKAVRRGGRKLSRLFGNGQLLDTDTSSRSYWSNTHSVGFTSETPSMTGEMILRFLLLCPEEDPESKQLATWRAMTRFDLRYLGLTARSLEQSISTKVLFPIPGLKTELNNPVFYMRPCRHNPFLKSNALLIDTLVYCMQTMLEDESAVTDGIALIAYMDGFTMKNYTPDYWMKLMQALEGHVTPVHVSRLFIVNPPALFGGVSAMMKTMVSADFQRRINMLPESELASHLMPGCEDFLPDDMATGRASTVEMINDWLTFRNYIEGGDESENPTQVSVSRFTLQDQPPPLEELPEGSCEDHSEHDHYARNRRKSTPQLSQSFNGVGFVRTGTI